MSRSPSSKTAKSPTGPAPTMATSVVIVSVMSALLRRRRDDEPVEGVGNLDLAGEPGIGPDLEGEVEHVLLHLGGRPDRRSPFLRDINMAGRAGAGPAAFRLDPRDGVAQRGLHHGRTVLRLDGACRAAGV